MYSLLPKCLGGSTSTLFIFYEPLQLIDFLTQYQPPNYCTFIHPQPPQIKQIPGKSN